MIGASSESFNLAAERLSGFNNDHVIVSIMAAYGILAGVAVIVLMAGLVIKVFHISLMQKNQLGMVLSIYRYKHILRETSRTGNWMSRKRRGHTA